MRRIVGFGARRFVPGPPRRLTWLLAALICWAGVVTATTVVTPALATTEALTWSAPIPVDQDDGISLETLSCPAANVCASLDHNGRVLTFNPENPAPPVPYDVELGTGLAALACPSVTQCTVIDSGGRQFTFNPQAPTIPAGVSVDPLSAPSPDSENPNSVSGLACPATTQCTAVDTTGREVTFDPTSPTTTLTRATLDPGTTFGFEGIACYSVTNCTATDGERVVNFDPADPGAPTPAKIVGSGDFETLTCPEATQCTAIDGSGEEITFNPEAPAVSLPTTLDRENYNVLDAVSCVSGSQCVAVSGGGREINFNPHAPGKPPARAIDAHDGGESIGQDEGLEGLSCFTATTCTAIDGNGREVNFNPRSPGHPKAVRIDPGNLLLGIACARKTECTAVDENQQATFNPLSPGLPVPHSIVANIGIGISGIGCPAASRCTIVRGEDDLSFDPQTNVTSKLQNIDPTADEGISGVACPSAIECVAVDGDGGAVSYNPETNQLIRKQYSIEEGESQVAVACASIQQCTSVDNDGTMRTFNPLRGSKLVVATIDAAVGLDAPSGDSDHELDGIACPTKTRCDAVDSLGDEVSFNPRSSHRQRPIAVDSGFALTGVACPSARICVAVDSAGRALVGAPRAKHWSVVPIAGAGPLTGVACPSAGECVAVDGNGNAFVEKG